MSKPARKQFNSRNLAVKAFMGLATAAALAAPLTTPTTTRSVGKKPGVWRWNVKTMADPAAKQINLSSPEALTVKTATEFSPPDDRLLTKTPRGVGPEEMQAYTIEGYIIKYKGEPDGDYHVLISDDAKDVEHVLGVEIVRPDYAPNSPFKSTFAAVRQAFESIVVKAPSKGGSYRTLVTPMKVKMTGVGFWDETHGQHGLHSGFELHPITKLEKVGN